MRIYGNATGLKPSQIDRIQRLYRRKIHPDKVISPEAARFLSEVSLEIGRQVGILVNRRGTVEYVIVGDQKGILIPDLSRHRGGPNRLRGLRCIHTHLRGEGLTDDDLTDLALLRLDLMTALAVDANGGSRRMEVGHLLADNPRGERWAVSSYPSPSQCDIEFLSFIGSLEDEFRRSQGLSGSPRDGERALLVGVHRKSRHRAEESMEELKDLARSSGVTVVDCVIQRPHELDFRFLIGRGKLKDLVIRCNQLGVDLIIFDNDLTPTQAAAIADFVEVRVIDRTQLILDIFAQRAKSPDGKVQVELAQLRYLLPRLSGKSTAFSRLAGGIGGRGPGETKLEIDRRRVRDRIHALEKRLNLLSRARNQRRSKRLRNGIPILSIIGYTNAGKSTLLNSLTNSHVAVEDRLFATLDTATRRLRFPRDRDVIVTDTVGFIRDLPPDLIGAFRATLDELRDADLLIHLVDISNPRFEEHIRSVQKILADLDLMHLPRLLVLNKEDLVGEDLVRNVCHRFGGIPISAVRRSTLPRLLTAIEERLWRPPRHSNDEYERGSSLRSERHGDASLTKPNPFDI
ncbi:MAG: GTPase HflX [Deltaproteobacteria bacterium]|nr:GTPase HflX [Deltaproteobacteria bacterium]